MDKTTNEKTKHVNVRLSEELWHKGKMKLVAQKQSFQNFFVEKLRQLVESA